MVKKSQVFNPLLAELVPHLAKLGFGASEVEEDIRSVYYPRVRPDYVERLGLGLESSPNKKGEWSFAVVCGVEFHDWDRERFWQMMPATHVADTMQGWIRSTALKTKPTSSTIPCKRTTNWGELAKNHAAWVEAAFGVIGHFSLIPTARGGATEHNLLGA